jgi:hypothetical protein
MNLFRILLHTNDGKRESTHIYSTSLIEGMKKYAERTVLHEEHIIGYEVEFLSFEDKKALCEQGILDMSLMRVGDEDEGY